MNLKTVILSVFLAGIASTGFAGWNVKAGYAWRQQAKTDFNAPSAAATGGTYLNGTYVNDNTWTFSGTFDTGRYWDASYTTALYSMGLTGSGFTGGGSDESAANGTTVGVSCDLWDNETFSVAFGGRFAGYWNMENEGAGRSAYTDHFSFASPTPVMGLGTPTAADPTHFEERVYGAASRMRLNSDLYQIGLGPQVTWHALSFLDVYAGVEGLCNLVHADFDSGDASTSETDCRLGFAGNVGLAGWILENVGLYAQVGYEWIDEDRISVGGVSATTDYSSLVLSAGVQARF